MGPQGVEPFVSVLEFKQLPLAVRKSLLQIRFLPICTEKIPDWSVSTAGSCLKGLIMDNGLYLEEITPEGVVLSFRSYRFSVSDD